MWIDSHAHVTAPEFDADRNTVLARARGAGVDALLAVGAGWGIDANEAAVELAQAEPDVFAAVGVHPHDARLLDDAGRAKLRGWLGRPRVVAVGECGLDYHYMHSTREVQRAVFAEQVALARERDLPVSIHVRGDDASAWDEMLDIWRAEGGGAVAGVLHCYTGTVPFARRALDARLEISFSGILTFKSAGDLREVAGSLPLERLLVETDAPLLAPVPHRGRRNEPAHVGAVGARLAELRGAPLEVVARATTANARRLFRLPEPPVG
ncbi:MAG TPA: TatD family hydrolase [Myxococcota bacterium]|nr:TatD family hydrolase [Myxococcota bacterium]